jgi:hypothetical protein
MRLDHRFQLSHHWRPAALAAGLALGALCVAAARPCAADPAGFAFLKVPAGARASAMGGAYASLEASHFEYLASLRHDQFGVGGRLFGGGISASIRALYSEPIPERDALGNLLGTFGSHDLGIALAYGRAAGAGVRLGTSVQLVRERIADAAATTWSAGFGATWDPARWKGVRLSADVHDLGPAARFTVDGTPGADVALPGGARLGIAYARQAGAFIARGALEQAVTSGQSGITMVGAELAHPSGLALRGGMRFGDTESTVSFGAGWAVRSLRFDYAFVPFRSGLGDTHRFTLATQL